MTEQKKQELTMTFLHQLANDLMFELDDEQCHNLYLEFEAIEQLMAQVTIIDTAGVVPLDYPLTIMNHQLRDDSQVATPLTNKAVLSVATQTETDFIVIKKVVN